MLMFKQIDRYVA